MSDELEKELDQAEQNLKLLRDGIPLRDNSGDIVGWMEKPDRQANEFLLKTKGRHRGYTDHNITESQKQNKKWHEI